MKNKLLNIINEEIEKYNTIRLYHAVYNVPSYIDAVKNIMNNGLIPADSGDGIGKAVWFSTDYDDYSVKAPFVLALDFDLSTNGWVNNKYGLYFDGRYAKALNRIPIKDLIVVKIPVISYYNGDFMSSDKVIEFLNKNKLITPEKINTNQNPYKHTIFSDLFNKYVQPHINIKNYISQLDPQKINIVELLKNDNLNEILDNLEGLDDSSSNLPLYGDHLKSISEETNNVSNKIWYHGTNSKFNKFIEMPPNNRVGNVSGFYFTDNFNIAKTYGTEVLSVKLNVVNPFILGKSIVTSKMIEQYNIELHNENPQLPLNGDWIVNKSNYFANKRTMPYTGLNGDSQQKIFRTGGYDSVIDGHEICVFDVNDIQIINN